MARQLAAVSLLLWVLLSVGPVTPTAARAGEVTLTLRTDQATYQMGSWATFTLTFDATTAMTVTMGGRDTLGCSWNLVILDATGTTVCSISCPSRCVSYRSLLSFSGGAMRNRTVQEGL